MRSRKRAQIGSPAVHPIVHAQARGSRLDCEIFALQEISRISIGRQLPVLLRSPDFGDMTNSKSAQAHRPYAECRSKFSADHREQNIVCIYEYFKYNVVLVR